MSAGNNSAADKVTLEPMKSASEREEGDSPTWPDKVRDTESRNVPASAIQGVNFWVLKKDP